MTHLFEYLYFWLLIMDLHAYSEIFCNGTIISPSLANESGITNPDVSVCSMMMDGTPLGIGNYYSSTGKTDIDVSAYP